MQRKAGVLAIDHGTKRTGFAVVDGLRIAAHALDGWRGAGGEEEMLAHVGGLLAERDVAVLLVGLPLDMSGGEGARAAEVRAFGRRLAARFPGQELLREIGSSQDERRRRKDSFAALVLLRDWIASGEPR